MLSSRSFSLTLRLLIEQKDENIFSLVKYSVIGLRRYHYYLIVGLTTSFVTAVHTINQTAPYLILLTVDLVNMRISFCFCQLCAVFYI